MKLLGQAYLAPFSRLMASTGYLPLVGRPRFLLSPNLASSFVFLLFVLLAVSALCGGASARRLRHEEEEDDNDDRSEGRDLGRPPPSLRPAPLQLLSVRGPSPHQPPPRCSLMVSRRAGQDSSSCGPPEQHPCATIAQAVANARDGQTVCVSADGDSGATYPCASGGGVMGVMVNKSIALQSINGSAVIDCAGGPGPAFVVQATTGEVIIDGFTFRNAGSYSPLAGAIVVANATSTKIRRCEFGNLTAGEGGAIYIDRSNVRLSDCAFVANRAQEAGALMIRGGNLTIERCNFTGMESAKCGVMIVQDADVSILNSTLASNRGKGDSGAICTAYNRSDIATLTIEDSEFVDNQGGSVGVLWNNNRVSSVVERNNFRGNTGTSGGIVIFQDGQAVVNQNRFDHNTGQFGGSIYIFGTVQMEMTNNSFVNNSAMTMGGAVYASLGGGSLLFLSDNAFESNQAPEGAAINAEFRSDDIKIIIQNNTFIANSASTGGAMFMQTATELDAGNEVWIRNNKFINNSASQSGGAIELDIANVTTHFEYNLLERNIAQSGSGGAIMLSHFGDNVQNVHHTFLGDQFIENSAAAPGGGAAYIHFPYEKAQRQTLDWIYMNNTNRFEGVLFQNNSANCPQCVGGALDVFNGMTELDGCTFSSNRATQLGGAIMISGSSSVLDATNCSFQCNHAKQGGSHLYSVSTGNLTLTGVVLQADEEAPWLISAPQGSIYTRMSQMDIKCPLGYVFENRTSHYSGYVYPWGVVPLLEMEIECTMCARGTYSLAGSHVLPSGGSIIAPVCFECPNGADCSLGGADLQALSGYYCGRTDNEAMADCILCPEGYCSDSLRPLDQVCATNREGILCGECQLGTSEALGIEDCVSETECMDNTWWLAIVLFMGGLIYVLVSVRMPINHHPLWKSITYFMQIVPLISSPDNGLLRATVAVFSLDVSILGLPVELCPWKSFSAVEKIASDYFLPALLLGQLLLVLALHWMYRSLMRTIATRWRDQHASAATPNSDDISHDEDDPTSLGHDAHTETSHRGEEWDYSRYVAAFVGLILLTYEGVTSATMELLDCTEWNGRLRLLRAGYITCYASWQYLLFAVLGGVLVPFPFALIGLRRWLASRLRSRKKDDNYEGEGAWEEAALEVLEHPYAWNRKWWESVGLLRRLALLTIATFVSDPTWRALSLAAGCFAVAFSHVYLRPFADRYHGTAEGFFLFNLVLIAMLEIPQSVADALGQRFEGTTASVVSYLQLALSLLPIAFCLWVVIKHYLRPLVTRDRLLRCWRFASCGWVRNGRGSRGLRINEDDDEDEDDDTNPSLISEETARLMLPDIASYDRSSSAEASEEEQEVVYQAIGDDSEPAGAGPDKHEEDV